MEYEKCLETFDEFIPAQKSNEGPICGLCKKGISASGVNFNSTNLGNCNTQILENDIPDIDQDIVNAICDSCQKSIKNISSIVHLKRETRDGNEPLQIEDHKLKRKNSICETIADSYNLLNDVCNSTDDDIIDTKKIDKTFEISVHEDVKENLPVITRQSQVVDDDLVTTCISKVLQINLRKFEEEQNKNHINNLILKKITTHSESKYINTQGEILDKNILNTYNAKILRINLQRIDLTYLKHHLPNNTSKLKKNPRDTISKYMKRPLYKLIENPLSANQTRISCEQPIYKCPNCSYKSKSKEKFEFHLDNHRNSLLSVEQKGEKKLYECKHCSYSTLVRYHFERHSIRHRDIGELRIFKCDKCAYRAKYHGNLAEHMKSHNKSLRFICYNCSYQTTNKIALVNHMVLHRKKFKVTEGGIYECLECPYKTGVVRAFQKHLIIVHDTPQKKYKCGECDFRCKTKHNLKGHSKIHKKTENVLTCLICDYETFDQYNFKRHKKIHMHLLKCKLCSYQTPYKSDLRKHTKIHGERMKLYCHNCTFETESKPQLMRHMNVHKPKNIITHRCQQCGYESKCKRWYLIHIETHKNCNEFGFHQCQICEFKSVYKKKFERHLESHKSKKIYKCQHCPLVFVKRRTFENHMFTHQTRTESKYYRCLFCSFKTKHKHNVRLHVKNLHAEKISAEGE